MNSESLFFRPIAREWESDLWEELLGNKQVKLALVHHKNLETKKVTEHVFSSYVNDN